MTDLRKAAEQTLFDLGATGNTSTASTTRQALAQPEQKPVAWMHNFIEGNVITHKPADIDRHPDRWSALYKKPTPCKTCQALAMTVMTDQAYHEKVIPKREWIGLTRDETYECWKTGDVVAAVAAKLKEKNT